LEEEKKKMIKAPEDEENESDPSLDKQHKILYRDYILKQEEFRR
jgi:hypothetical protein